MILDQHLALVVYSNILLSYYNNFWNKHNTVDRWLFNDVLDLSQFFWCYHMFFDNFLLADQKSFFHQSQHCNLLLLQLEEDITFNLFNVHYLRTIKQKVYLLLENLDQLNNLSIGFVLILILLIDVYSI